MTELCKGHILPKGVGGAEWVPQRKDVDNFFGSFVEADFMHGLTLRELAESRDLPAALRYINEQRLRRKVDLSIHAEGTRISAEPRSRDRRLEVEVVDSVSSSLEDHTADIEIRFNPNMLFQTVVACLHTAHLGIFRRVKYAYVADDSGWFVGSMLGELFRQYGSKSERDKRRRVRADAATLPEECVPHGNMVRPVLNAERLLDPRVLESPFHWFHVAWDQDSPFATIHYLNVGAECHAVMMYTAFDERTFAHASSAQPLSFEVRLAHSAHGRISVAPHGHTVVWPCGDIQHRSAYPLRAAAEEVLRNGHLEASRLPPSSTDSK